MGKVTDHVFKPVKFDFGQVHIAGGHTATPAAVTSKSVEGSDKKQHIFVKMAAKKRWLLSAVCGSQDKNQKAFRRTSLLNTLRDHVARIADGIDSSHAPPVAAAVEYDPMSEIGSVRNTTPAFGTTLLSADNRGRKRYYTNRAKNCIVTVNVTSRCPEMDPQCTQMRAVKMFIVDRKTVWLSIDDVAWAVRYLFDQHHLKGIPLVADDDAGPGGGVAGSVPVGP